MNLTDTASLVRGATIIDYALSDNAAALMPTVPELIGMVAGIAARGGYPMKIERELDNKLGFAVAERMRLVVELFNDWDAKGLWHQGAAYDDFYFTNDILERMYPSVNAEYRRKHGNAGECS